MKEAPDEFAVYKRAPLSLPPDFDLRPPSPGTQRPHEVNPKDSARRALGLGVKSAERGNIDSRDLAGLSDGERAVLKFTGAENVTNDIRMLVESESSFLYERDKGMVDKVIFWQSQQQFGTVVDAEKESRRIREAQALGQKINTHDVPIISRKKKALFEGVFD